MNIKFYLFGIFLGFIFTLGVWILMLFNIDPFQADFLIIATFFATLFLWLWCVSTLIGYYLRVWSGNNEVVFSNLPIASRQGILLALIIVGLLILSTINILTWWIGAIWVLVISFMELFFRTRSVQ